MEQDYSEDKFGVIEMKDDDLMHSEVISEDDDLVVVDHLLREVFSKNREYL